MNRKQVLYWCVFIPVILSIVNFFVILAILSNIDERSTTISNASSCSVDHDTLSKFLDIHGISITPSGLKTLEKEAYEGDLICSLISKSMDATGTNMCILKLDHQSLKGLPKNSLIRVSNQLLILDHITNDSIFFWGTGDKVVVIESYESFEQRYLSNESASYVLVNRGYDLR